MRILITLLSILLLFSCSTYTIAEARERIDYPERGVTETRLRIFQEEEERKKEEERLRAERERVNEYPLEEEKMTYPFYHNPVKNGVWTLPSENAVLRTIFVPLGEEELTPEQLKCLSALLRSHDFNIIALSGSFSNQTRLASVLGMDCVTTEGGSVIFSGLVLSHMSEDHVTLSLSGGETLTVYSADMHPVIPEEEDAEDLLLLADKLERHYAEGLIDSISGGSDEKEILFLSSIAPSSADWSDWTEYPYRSERSFLISDTLSLLKWTDTFDYVRFSEETDSGATRFSGEYEERLDFIYSKGLMVKSSYTVAVEGLENRAVTADFLIPQLQDSMEDKR